MSDYKADKISGWQRAKKVTIINEFGDVPRIVFQEEIIVNADTLTVKKDVGELMDTLSDPSTQFNLLNPQDDTVLSTMTYGEAYAVLYSIYRHLTNKRDNPVG